MKKEDEVILDQTGDTAEADVTDEAIAVIEELEADDAPIDLESDIENFKQIFPNVRLDKLVATPAFLGFGKYRFGVEPFADIYKDYSEFVKAIENAALAKRASRNERSTGGGQSTPYTGLTREQSEQLELWNKAYPHLKMTPREFLSK